MIIQQIAHLFSPNRMTKQSIIIKKREDIPFENEKEAQTRKLRLYFTANSFKTFRKEFTEFTKCILDEKDRLQYQLWINCTLPIIYEGITITTLYDSVYSFIVLSRSHILSTESKLVVHLHTLCRRIIYY
jgi:hypothetical protein